MGKVVEVRVPDIGDFKDVEIIDVLVKAGDTVRPEDPLITLESEKASIDIPAPRAGTVKALKVKKGDKVSEGDAILDLEAEAAAETEARAEAGAAEPEKPSEEAAEVGGEPVPTPARASGEADMNCQLLVLGSGPGGYTAAFRAADLGLDVVMVERYAEIGGVCLNVGCIPSKALLHAGQVIEEAEAFAEHGIDFGKPKIDLGKLAGYKDGVVAKLTGGLKQLAKKRKVRLVQGVGRFSSPNTLEVEGDGGRQVIGFEQAIIAAGSQAVKLPGFPWDDDRVMDSTDALMLKDVPKRLLVVGGGIIGLEMACVYDALGAKVTVCELSADLMPGTDRDLVKPLEKRIKGRYEAIYRARRWRRPRREAGHQGVLRGRQGARDRHLRPGAGGGGSQPQRPEDQCRGRRREGGRARLHRRRQADAHQRAPHLRHRRHRGPAHAGPQGRPRGQGGGRGGGRREVPFRRPRHPVGGLHRPGGGLDGLTETEAKEKGVEYTKGVFPWAASGRAHQRWAARRGLTKLLFDEHGRVAGAGIVGPNAGELIAEAVLALEMGADMEDVGLTIHPHPTLSETLCFAAEVAHGSVTDILVPRRK
jgi:dihydrolipoamide dehydrogenase